MPDEPSTSPYGLGPIAQSMRFMADPNFPDDVILFHDGLQPYDKLRAVAWAAHRDGDAKTLDNRIMAVRVGNGKS